MPVGQAGGIRHATNKKSRIFFICCASPGWAVKIAVPIILAQRKGHEKIGNRNDFAALRQLVQKWLFKGKVRRKLRWVKSGFNQQLIDCHLAADVLFSN